MQVETRRIESLLPYARNAKHHPQSQVRALARFIRRVGFRIPVHVDPDGVIIAGHGRVLAAKRLGMAEVPVIVQTGLSDVEARELRLADNRFAEMAEDVEDVLIAELDDLEGMGIAPESLGFDPGVLDDDDDKQGRKRSGGNTSKIAGLVYKIVIECDDEEHQAEALEALEQEGYKCQPLIV